MPSIAFPPEQAAPEIAPLWHAAAQDRLRALTTLAGGLAHSLRSPLTAIMGRAELISFRQPELREQMHGVVAECERINALLHEVTAELALEAETAPRPVNLNELVERACEFMRFDRFFKHEVEKEFVLADALPSVAVVYGALVQAFKALAHNAVMAMRDAAERRLVVTTESRDGGVVLTVRDTGCGIPPENLARVFEPGFTTCEGQRYGPSPVEGTGRGYGLTAAAAAVRDCGGTLEVSSEPGAGTTVTMTFPVR